MKEGLMMMLNIRKQIKKTELHFRFPFAITHGTRTKTDALFLQLQDTYNNENIFGYGEATLPPYLKESIDDVVKYIENFPWYKFSNPQTLLQQLELLSCEVENPCARTIIEMAFLDFIGHFQKKSIWNLLNIESNLSLNKKCSYTLSLSDGFNEIEKKLQVAPNFSFYKIKLTGIKDLEKIQTILPLINTPFMVDANMAWNDAKLALEIIQALAQLGCVAVEQPLKVEAEDEAQWLKEKSPLPLIADESMQTTTDLKIIAKQFHGINIKTLKFGGLLNSLKISRQAKSLGLLIQVGCMSESSLGCSYALPLISDASFIDLDGPLLINNDPFVGIQFEKDGTIVLPKGDGLGVRLNSNLF